MTKIFKVLNFDTAFKIIVVIVLALILFKSVDLDKDFINKDSNKITIVDNTAIINNLRKDNEDLKDLIKQLKSENVKILKSLEGKVNEVGKVVGKIGGTSTDSEIADEITEDGVEFKNIFLTNTKGDSIPIAWAEYNPLMDINKWKTGIYRLEFHTILAKSYKDDVENIAVELRLKNIDDETLDVFPIDVASIIWAKSDDRVKSMRWFNPRGSIGFITGMVTAPTLSLSLASYGKSKVDMTYRFLTFGLGYNGEQFVGLFDPISYNVGEKIPFVQNTFIGPMLVYDGYSFKGSIDVSVPF